ncbi:MAG: FGGY-family carbohydrate kinase [Pseudomonadota bacterium]
MTGGHVAVIDIGKTNAKLALVDPTDLSEIAVVTQPNTVRPGPPYPHFDVERHWAFLLDNLRSLHGEHGVAAITITTHGAAAALIGREGALAAPILDYEYTGPERLAPAYDALRPPFSETGSPRLAMGLNVGAQLHYQFETLPGVRAATRSVVTYPQYWALRLTGVAATDVTSLGAHTDLWNPFEGRFSALVDRLGLAGKMAPPRPCGDVLGPILPEIATRTGLPADTPVHCGLHDSNASLVPHLLHRSAPFSVLSTGTWVIAMAVGGAPVTLDPARDTLVNVNAFGDPVPSARFMGGREHDLATGGAYPEPTAADIRRVLTAGTMLLPALVPEIGPFAGRKARWVGAEPEMGTVARGVCTGLYLALVASQCLELIGHRGPIVVEGPFAANMGFKWMLGAATGCSVETSGGTTGTSQGAALLAHRGARAPGPPSVRSAPAPEPAPPRETVTLLERYAREWRRHAQHGAPSR